MHISLKTAFLRFCLAIFLVATGIGTVFAYKEWIRLNTGPQTKRLEASSVTPTPSPTPYTFSPPGMALSGVLASASGTISTVSRDSETGEAKAASPGAAIVQGDTLIADEDARAFFTLGDDVTLALLGQSRVDLVNLVPKQSILFRQTDGKVWYRTLNDAFPLTIRSYHLLVNLPKGIVVVENDDVGIVVTAVEGTSTLGYIDTDNNTQTVTLEQGQYVIFNDTLRTVHVARSQDGLRFPQ